MRHPESILQAQIVRWLAYQYPQALFSGGFAGEKLSIQQAIRRHRMGYRKGTPDVILLEPRAGYHGLMVEVKSEDGRLSPAQAEFLALADSRGYKTLVVYGFTEAQQAISAYLGQLGTATSPQNGSETGPERVFSGKADKGAV